MTSATLHSWIAIAAGLALAACAGSTVVDQAYSPGDPVDQCKAQAARLDISLGEPDHRRGDEFLAIGPGGEDRFVTTVWPATSQHDEVACTCKNGEPVSLAVGDAEVWER
ncbi:hypothetical protein LTR94_024750 [Friedmanniomyces endolithicus]|nr:hypothetical protein LTR94_024750 [Friedmanniomyces endolithicus]